ncbi:MULTISPECIES: daunorubicin resistance protein DrrA family ABC transporter ATP-binding protein [Paenibacillus]|uniref:Daunorubicin resistance ABC transporter ATPase subunit n=1 Tax=Paenibacillus polymyxa TaxID=1406 RepID=A0A378Y846_PAEPO|nr:MULTISPECIES: daunorubicin resistance protein DrrA family ABC transporter ATP-binding protein [Paenibacillus]KAF6586902.1 daunorubicin resistance protein DrrA family ABC transporter ATP-binding protein [Paenibacillus sp. EKM211P]MBE7899406.1 daunorubicin resistance protein DrrA family ABC transporter ATP-binding protein [Paenibacillus polymyxa]MBG9762437.1 ABC transporter ATP-binding protein [Paenibacillus polymyxa]MCC3258589.1 daunorubicin resistance protein DrrA family ABC transporter ATP-
MTELAISTKEIVKEFPNKRAVDGISLDIKKGEIFGILGPNGAGKTTFLRMLATITKVSKGKAMIFGKDVTKDAQKVRSLIGLTGQYATVDEELTAMENLKLFGQLNGLSASQSKARALELLNQFSLTEAKDRPIREFSGGMRRRLDLSVSLIVKPPLIFLDEPTTGLDPRTRGEMWEVIRNLASDGATILLTTQYLEEADQLADRLAIINHGRIISQGTPNELKSLLSDTHFEITLEYMRDAERAKGLIKAEIAQEAMISPEGTKLTVKLADTKVMTRLLLDLTQQDIEIKEFSVRKPTLDEVFLELTK